MELVKPKIPGYKLKASAAQYNESILQLQMDKQVNTCFSLNTNSTKYDRSRHRQYRIEDVEVHVASRSNQRKPISDKEIKRTIKENS